MQLILNILFINLQLNFYFIPIKIYFFVSQFILRTYIAQDYSFFKLNYLFTLICYH